MSSYADGRKQHVHADQDAMLEVLRETNGGELPVIARYFGISEATARKKLDGLVAQGKLRVEPGWPRKSGRMRCTMPRFYWPGETV